MSQKLGAAIRDDFGSLDQLKSTVSAAAMGLSSSGWIWFATDQRGYTGVIPTFGSGTLLVRSRTMMESPMGSTALGENLSRTPQKTPSAKWTQPPATSGLVPPAATAPQNPLTPPSRSLHTTSPWAAPNAPIYTSKAIGLHGADTDGNPIMGNQDEGVKFNSIGSMLYPLFCVSVHEHAWMSAGYGIWGKEEYLKRFWTVLDWKKVSEAYAKFSPDRT
jgi:Fe-Mn family superoxide dismutase